MSEITIPTKIYINEAAVTVPTGLLHQPLIEILTHYKAHVPRFCYHHYLGVAGNCRMCLVEVNHRLTTACSTQVQDGMIVNTTTSQVIQAQKGVLEFLLLNHPLDCPVCDKGGECYLQDTVMKYGQSTSAFTFHKRDVPNLELGPVISTVMTRCIHCTRCIRFMSDVACMPELATSNKGSDMLITSLNQALGSELAGNLAEICPVGALNVKPHIYQTRPWEYQQIATVDATDPYASSIILDIKEGQIMRIRARYNDNINHAWISDRTRFFYEGLKYQRLDAAYLRDENGILVEKPWLEINKVIKELLNNKKCIFVMGEMTDLFTVESYQKLAHEYKHPVVSNLVAVGNINPRKNDVKTKTPRASKRKTLFSNQDFSCKIHPTEVYNYTSIVIIGDNLRATAPMINMHIARHKKLNPLTLIYVVANEPYLLNYEYTYLKKPDKELFKSLTTSLFFIVGFYPTLYLEIQQLGIATSQIQMLLMHSGHPSHLACGVSLDLSSIYQDKEVVFIVGGEKNINIQQLKSQGVKIIYENSHAASIASKADIILPSASVFEKEACYQDMYGTRALIPKIIPAKGTAIASYEIASLLSKSPEQLDQQINGRTNWYLDAHTNWHPDKQAGRRENMHSNNPVLIPLSTYKSSKTLLPSSTKDILLHNFITELCPTLAKAYVHLAK